MEDHNIEVAKRALILFVKSLPAGCKYSIISFGGPRYELHRNFTETEEQNDGVWDYTDENVEKTVVAINKFLADFDNTQLVEPLRTAINLAVQKTSGQARIFVLTDGAVENSTAVFEETIGLPEHVRISTFGVGFTYDEILVTKLAELGHGSVTRIGDVYFGADLSEQVVKTLRRSMYERLQGCILQWLGEKEEKLEGLY